MLHDGAGQETFALEVLGRNLVALQGNVISGSHLVHLSQDVLHGGGKALRPGDIGVAGLVANDSLEIVLVVALGVLVVNGNLDVVVVVNDQGLVRENSIVQLNGVGEVLDTNALLGRQVAGRIHDFSFVTVHKLALLVIGVVSAVSVVGDDFGGLHEVRLRHTIANVHDLGIHQGHGPGVLRHVLSGCGENLRLGLIGTGEINGDVGRLGGLDVEDQESCLGYGDSASYHAYSSHNYCSFVCRYEIATLRLAPMSNSARKACPIALLKNFVAYSSSSVLKPTLFPAMYEITLHVSFPSDWANARTSSAKIKNLLWLNSGFGATESP